MLLVPRVRNPRPSRWREETKRSTLKASLDHPDLQEHPFRTFMLDPNANVATNERYKSHRTHGGKRRELLRWGRTLLDGIFFDDVEIIEDALAMPLFRVVEIQGGHFGAPLSFGGEAVLSAEHATRPAKRLIAEAKDMAKRTKRFYSDLEWQNIESHLRAKAGGLYGEDRLFEDLKLGDNAIHIAIRHGSLIAAKRLLEVPSFDPLARNRQGESIASLLEDQCRKYLEADALTRESARATKSEKDQWRDKQAATRRKLRALADDLVKKLETYFADVVEPTKLNAWQADLQGLELADNEQQILQKEPPLLEDLDRARAVQRRTVPLATTKVQALTVRALFSKRPTTKKNALLTIGDACYGTNSKDLAALQDEANNAVDATSSEDGSLSSLDSAFLDQVDLDKWIHDLDHAALLVQSAWRGNIMRTNLVRHVHTVSALQMQAISRGNRARRKIK